MAKLKEYIGDAVYDDYRTRHEEVTRMSNGLEKLLEQGLPDMYKRWPLNTPFRQSDRPEVVWQFE